MGLDQVGPPMEPADAQIASIRRGFTRLTEGSAEALEQAEDIFSTAVQQWRELRRPPGEVAQLLIARAKARSERNELAGGRLRPLLEAAEQDYTEAIGLMRADPRVAPVRADGTAEYQEFPDAFVRRGLANEGLGRWEEAVRDYSTAIGLWGGELNGYRAGEFSQGGRLGVNPFVLNFRGNALSQLGRYEEAAADYRTASAQFGAVSDNAGLLKSLANQALALYGAGQLQEAERIMQRVLRRNPSNVDIRTALAAIYWDRGAKELAESQWQFACDQTEEGCARYKDPQWVRGVRRWPAPLVATLERFVRREPSQVKEQ